MERIYHKWTRSRFLKISQVMELGGTWKEQAVWLSVAVASAGDKAGDVFHMEGFVQGRMRPPLFVGTDWNDYLVSLTGPQYPSLPTSPVCSVGLSPLICSVTRKTITVYLR